MDQMRKDRVAPDLITYSALINACEKGGQWQAALEQLSTMVCEQVQPNVITFNSAISACEKGAPAEVVVGLLDQMHAAGVQPDTITMNAAMLACGKGRKQGLRKAWPPLDSKDLPLPVDVEQDSTTASPRHLHEDHQLLDSHHGLSDPEHMEEPSWVQSLEFNLAEVAQL